MSTLGNAGFSNQFYLEVDDVPEIGHGIKNSNLKNIDFWNKFFSYTQSRDDMFSKCCIIINCPQFAELYFLNFLIGFICELYIQGQRQPLKFKIQIRLQALSNRKEFCPYLFLILKLKHYILKLYISKIHSYAVWSLGT